MPISKMAAFHSASKRERKALLDCFDRLAANPFLESDWKIDDSTGRTHYRLQVGKFLVTDWSDLAVSEYHRPRHRGSSCPALSCARRLSTFESSSRTASTM